MFLCNMCATCNVCVCVGSRLHGTHFTTDTKTTGRSAVERIMFNLGKTGEPCMVQGESYSRDETGLGLMMNTAGLNRK